MTAPQLTPTTRSLVFAILVAAIPAAAQEEPVMDESMQAEMAAWMAAAQPGKGHLHLAAYVGDWRGEVTMWMAPDQPPFQETVTMKARLILGGRFLETSASANFGGMAFEGVGLDGFNNLEERYEASWVDNFGTLMLHYKGTTDENGKRTMTTSFTDAMTGRPTRQRIVYTWIDDDHWTYESYFDQGDGEFKNMEIRYARAE